MPQVKPCKKVLHGTHGESLLTLIIAELIEEDMDVNDNGVEFTTIINIIFIGGALTDGVSDDR